VTKSEAWFSHAATVLVGGTGVVYGWMRYFAEPVDEFAVVNHPLEPTTLHLHILFAPLVIFACGLVWRSHVWKRVVSGFSGRRKTGLVLFAVFVPMAVTGYLIQTTTSLLWSNVWIWVHVAASIAWLVGYAVHQLTPRQ
jgi:hypothetical protein